MPLTSSSAPSSAASGASRRIFVRAASGRQRFNVLGAWNAVTRQLIAVTNTTVVNTDTMCELLRKIAAEKLTGPITVVLDNARYQRNKVVQSLAAELGIRLLFLPPYSPNLNLIERLWGFAKRQSVYGKYHADLRLVPNRHRIDLREPFHHPRQQAENPDDAHVSRIRRCLTLGRVRYKVDRAKWERPTDVRYNGPGERGKENYAGALATGWRNL